MGDVVAFQGVKGANSELAIRQYFGDKVEVYPCADLTTLFDTIHKRKVQRILLPVENALAGPVAGAYELLLEHDLVIQAEVLLHVHHALAAPAGMRLEDVHFARSHPQALAQCERFLKRHNIKPIIWHDTAGAAQDVAIELPEHTAAIANTYAAELYGLNILSKDIEDVPFNFTRFFVLGYEESAPAEYNKTSVVFAVKSRPASLWECLGEFAQRGINLTKIESRPRKNRPFEPVFYLDFEGHWQDNNCQEALVRLLQRASFVKMLGSYPAVKTDLVGM